MNAVVGRRSGEPLASADLERTAHEIETLGFSVVEGVVDATQVQRLRAALLEALAADQRAWGHRPQKTPDLIHNLAVYGGPFIELLDNAIMHQVFERFLGTSSILYNYGSTILEPGGTPGSATMHVDSPRLIPNYHLGLVMTLALDPFTEANGASSYLPGSQNLMAPPAAESFARFSLRVTRGSGAAVFFNPRCFHKAEPNRSAEVRCGLTVFAVRPWMKQRFDFPRLVDGDRALAETVAAQGPRVRRFLGFDARVPASLAEFYVDADDRLYKPNQG